MSNNDQIHRVNGLHTTGMDAFFQQHLQSGNSFDRFSISYQTPAMAFSNFPHSSYGNFIPTRQPMSSNTLPSIGNFADPLSFIPYPSHLSSVHTTDRRERLPEFSSIVTSSIDSTLASRSYLSSAGLETKRHGADNMYSTSVEHQKANSVSSPVLPQSPLPQPLSSQLAVPPSYITAQHSQDYHSNHLSGFPEFHVGPSINSSHSSISSLHSSSSPSMYPNTNVTPSTRLPQQTTPQTHHPYNTSTVQVQSPEEGIDDEEELHTSTERTSENSSDEMNNRNKDIPLVIFSLLGRLEICNKEARKPFVTTADVAIQTESILFSKDNEVLDKKSYQENTEGRGVFNILSIDDLDEYQSSKSKKSCVVKAIGRVHVNIKNSDDLNSPNKYDTSKIKLEKGENGAKSSNRNLIKKDMHVFSKSFPAQFGPGMDNVLPGMLASLPLSAFKGKDKDAEMERMEINVKIDDSQFVAIGDGPKRWQCTQCPKSYTTKHNLVTHVLDHNGIKPHLCMICRKYFKQLSHLNTHMLTHENNKPNICPVCGKGFTQVSHLKRHQAVHLDSKPHICDICNRGFAYPSELRIHKEKHIPNKDIKCYECDEVFENQKQLKEHLATHDNREDHECPECNKLFRYPSQLKDHLTSHSGHRPYICPECGMDFIKEHHLKAHQFTHTGLRPYECPQCSRTFNQRANMIRHQLIHSNDRAYKCEECDKSFTQPQTLKAHMVVHADKKPHQCNLCGKEFGRQHNLQAHMHMHSDSKPFLCFCGSSFTLKGNLKRHKKIKHGIDDSTESMEEEAVSFLSTMSVRANQSLSVSSDITQDSDSLDSLQTGLISPDGKSQRKQRKSIPRKIPQPDSESAEEDGSPNQKIEDTENEETVNRSRFFTALNQPYGKSSGKLLAMKRSYSDIHGSEDDDYNPSKRIRTKSNIPNQTLTNEDEDDELDEEDEIFDEEDVDENEEIENDDEWIPTNKPRVTKGKKLASVLAEKFSRSNIT